MRRKFKHLSYFLSTGIFLFLGCQTEEIPVTEDWQKPIRRATKVSFSTFKQLTGLSDFNTTFTLSKGKGLSTRRTNESYTPEDFIVDTNQIIQTISGGKTSYAFLMTPKNGEKEDSRFYLIVYDKEGSWLDMVIQSDVFIDADGNPNETGFREIYASAARGTGCTTVFTWVIKCNRKGKCADGVCDRGSICLKAGSERICGNDKEDYLDGGWTKPLQPDTGGGGSPNPETDSDEETVVNLPIQTIILRNDPCKDLKEKSENISFKEKMEELKGKAATQNFESAYAMYQNPAEGLSFSPEATGTVNEPAVELTLNMSSTQTPTNAIGFIHCHLDNGRTFKVFSFTNIIALAYVASVSTRPTSELGIFVTTASGTFALKVNDRIALKNNLLWMQMAQKSYEKEFAEKVDKDHPLDKQVLGLLRFMKKAFKDRTLGIDLYQQDSNGTWEKLELSNNEKNVNSKKC
ncbi:hypothetical protein [Flavobacterium lindanitolerans]|uniref:hypothetical protein n=1 Tax=Flavobacterium lindanitolerans TaxID=428988 RepID=UPI0028084036|nr:hypothetical protein [Flavobacterium lindanitolerans]MDQ7961696.1 hypothetical protein [Flavobacterium lindanitolerans]